MGHINLSFITLIANENKIYCVFLASFREIPRHLPGDLVLLFVQIFIDQVVKDPAKVLLADVMGFYIIPCICLGKPVDSAKERNINILKIPILAP